MNREQWKRQCLILNSSTAGPISRSPGHAARIGALTTALARFLARGIMDGRIGIATATADSLDAAAGTVFALKPHGCTAWWSWQTQTVSDPCLSSAATRRIASTRERNEAAAHTHAESLASRRCSRSTEDMYAIS